jgi:hypothetical protein
MRRLLLVVVMGCGGGDPLAPEWRDLVVAAQTPGPQQYERACLEKPDLADAGECRFVHVSGERTECSRPGAVVVVIEEMRGCCTVVESNTVRWHECM